MSLTVKLFSLIAKKVTLLFPMSAFFYNLVPSFSRKLTGAMLPIIDGLKTILHRRSKKDKG